MVRRLYVHGFHETLGSNKRLRERSWKVQQSSVVSFDYSPVNVRSMRNRALSMAVSCPEQLATVNKACAAPTRERTLDEGGHRVAVSTWRLHRKQLQDELSEPIDFMVLLAGFELATY